MMSTVKDLAHTGVTNLAMLLATQPGSSLGSVCDTMAGHRVLLKTDRRSLIQARRKAWCCADDFEELGDFPDYIRLEPGWQGTDHRATHTTRAAYATRTTRATRAVRAVRAARATRSRIDIRVQRRGARRFFVFLKRLAAKTETTPKGGSTAESGHAAN